ncbi:hypothetical protein QV12_01680 [Pseudomonas putida]|nr:hypothetical protein QV12_01680 [Pseudomonas putida]
MFNLFYARNTAMILRNFFIARFKYNRHSLEAAAAGVDYQLAMVKYDPINTEKSRIDNDRN